MACVVMIFFEDDDPAADRRAPFYLVETEFEDFASFCKAVEADMFIGGCRLDTRWGDARGERVVWRRVPLAFRGSAVRRTELPTWRIVEEGT